MNKILILSNSSGGLYNFRIELIEELIRRGFELHISAPRGSKGDLLQNIGTTFIETTIDRRGINPVNDLRLFSNYLTLIRDANPDLVLTYTVKPNIYGSMACRIANKPYLNNITGLGSAFLNSGLLSNTLVVMYKMAFKKSRMVFFQNTDNLNFMVRKGIIAGPRKLIPGSGVNLERFTYAAYPAESESIVFNFIGRVMRDKGIDEYLLAAKAIKNKYPATVFNVIGSVESSQTRYNQIIAEYEEAGYISYLGHQSDIRPFLRDSNCIIHPSRGGEGMSNVLLETAATGRPLIASNIPGCREIIDNDINGYLFDVGNVDDLIEAIEEFINIPQDEKEAMGKQSRIKVEREFDRQIVIDAYLEEIEKATEDTIRSGWIEPL